MVGKYKVIILCGTRGTYRKNILSTMNSIISEVKALNIGPISSLCKLTEYSKQNEDD